MFLRPFCRHTSSFPIVNLPSAAYHIIQAKTHPYLPHIEGRPNHRGYLQMRFPALCHYQDHPVLDRTHTHMHYIHTFSRKPPLLLNGNFCFDKEADTTPYLLTLSKNQVQPLRCSECSRNAIAEICWYGNHPGRKLFIVQIEGSSVVTYHFKCLNDFGCIEFFFYLLCYIPVKKCF